MHACLQAIRANLGWIDSNQQSTFHILDLQIHHELPTSKASPDEFDKVWERLGDDNFKHLQLDDICVLFGPRSSSVEAVREWAATHGAINVTPTRYFFSFQLYSNATNDPPVVAQTRR